MYRRLSILVSLCAVGVCAGGPAPVEAQIFFSRSRARSDGTAGRVIRSPLLDRMFSRNSCALRPSRQSCIPFAGRSVSLNYYSDGTPFDPYSVGSFPDRFQNSAALYGNTALSTSLRDSAYVSSNAANLQAPAQYRLTMPSVDTGVQDLTPRPIGGGWTMATGGPFIEPSPEFALSSPPGAGGFGQSMWTAQRERLGQPMAAAPSDGRANIALGVGDKSFRRGEYTLARDDYRRALARNVNDADAYLALGLAEFARGRLPAASRAIAEGLKRSPSIDADAFDVRNAYGRDGDFEKHLARLESTAAASPGDAELWLLLGYVRFFSGDTVGGPAAWEKYSTMPQADLQVKAFIQSLPR